MAFTIGSVASAQSFSEEAVSRGVVYSTPTDSIQFGSGLGLADLDNDGDPDLIATGSSNGLLGLWENDGTGHFTSRIFGSGLPTLILPSGVSAADYDNDGDLDLHLANWFGGDKLMRNDGNFKFTDVSAAAGVANDGAGFGCAWGDFDGDGWLDLYVPNRTGTNNNFARNRLYRNNGNGTFTDVAEALGVTDGDAPTLVSAFFDYDRDGDADLYIGNDKGALDVWYNHLYRNNGDGTFTDVSIATGTDADVDCMGIAYGDFDRNRWMDIYVTNIAIGNVLLMHQSEQTFTDQTISANVGSYAISWGTQFLDYDHDMLMDLFMVNTTAPNRMFKHNGLFPCTNEAPALGLEDASFSYVFAMGDIDMDGDLDLVTQTHNQNLRVFVNNASSGNWVKFRVVGQGNNGFGVGTIIDTNVGGVWQCRELQMGNNYKAQNDHLQHFGLGSATSIDQIDVAWPGGDSRTLTGYASNRTWTLYPPERMGDADGDGAIDADDFIAALSCYQGAFEPGCEVFDIDGDGDVDASDIGVISEAVFGQPLTPTNRWKQGFHFGG